MQLENKTIILLHHFLPNTFSIFNISHCNHNRHLQSMPTLQSWKVNLNPSHGDNSYLDWFLESIEMYLEITKVKIFHCKQESHEQKS